MIARRTVLAGGAASAAALGLAACGSDSSKGSGTDGKGKTLTLWIMEGTNPSTDAYIADLKKKFKEATQADLTVEVQPWDGAHDKFVNVMGGDSAPDVAEVGTTWTPEFADAGGLDPIGDELEEAGLSGKYVKALEESATLEGEVFGAPSYAGVRSILANKDLLSAAGVDKQPGNWQELLDAARALKKKDPSTIPFPISGGSPFGLLPFIWGAGGEIAKQSGDTWKAAIADSPAVEGVTWYTDIALKHKLSTPAASTWKETDALAAFQKGDVGMFITGSWVPATIKEKSPELYDKLMAFTIPAKDSEVAPSFLGGSHLCRFTGTKEPELAFELIKLMTTGEFAANWAKQTNFFPGEQSALDEVVTSGDDLTAVFAKQMTEGGKSVPVTPLWGQVEGKKTIPNLLNTVLTGGKDAATACQDAAKEMDQIFAD